MNSIIQMLAEVERQSELEYAAIKRGNYKKRFSFGNSGKNIFAWGDNLSFMKYLADIEKMAGKIDMIYIDPPFFSKAVYSGTLTLEMPTESQNGEISGSIADKKTEKKNSKTENVLLGVAAYDDHRKEKLFDYLMMLATRLRMMKDLLKDTGTIWVHLDWHAVHYVKLLMDSIFGEKNFINEVIWSYKSGGSSRRTFARKHDTLLFYSKSRSYTFNPLKEKSYNRGFKPYKFKGVQEFEDEHGWYTKVNMRDVWTIDMVGRTSAERNGYATQKPEELLRRIIESSTSEGDICADFFAGSGTLAVVAYNLKRNFIACDAGGFSTATAGRRLLENGAGFELLIDDDTEINPGGAAVSFVSDAKDSSFQTAGSKETISKEQIEKYEIKHPEIFLDSKDAGKLERYLKTGDPAKLVSICGSLGNSGEKTPFVMDVFGNIAEIL